MLPTKVFRSLDFFDSFKVPPPTSANYHTRFIEERPAHPNQSVAHWPARTPTSVSPSGKTTPTGTISPAVGGQGSGSCILNERNGRS